MFAVLAEAEAALHGTAVDDVEFHEVGSLDAIVDVVGVCAALEVLGVERVVCSPISVGRGEIRAAHGVLPNPAPAVAAIAAAEHFARKSRAFCAGAESAAGLFAG